MKPLDLAVVRRDNKEEEIKITSTFSICVLAVGNTSAETE